MGLEIYFIAHIYIFARIKVAQWYQEFRSTMKAVVIDTLRLLKKNGQQ